MVRTRRCCLLLWFLVIGAGCQSGEPVPPSGDLPPQDVASSLDVRSLDAPFVDARWDDLPGMGGEVDVPVGGDVLLPPAPVFEAFEAVIDPDMGLVAWVVVHTDLPTQLTVTVEDLVTGLVAPVPYGAAFKVKHKLVVMDLRAESSYQIRVTAITDTGGESEDAVEVETLPLPGYLDDLEVELVEPDKMQPGYTLLSVRTDEQPLFVALDREGEVAFYAWNMGGGCVVPTQFGHYITDLGPSGGVYVADLTG